jgi:hypothetical protein
MVLSQPPSCDTVPLKYVYPELYSNLIVIDQKLAKMLLVAKRHRAHFMANHQHVSLL